MLKQLENTIYKIDSRIAELSIMHLQKLQYGDSCNVNAIAESLPLRQLRATLTRELQRRVRDCECACNIDRTIAIVNTKVGKTRATDQLVADRTNEQDWILRHPNCVAREIYEKYCRNLCHELNIEVTAEFDQLCELGFDITSEVISCDLLTDISVIKQVCDLGFSIHTSREKCQLELDLIREEIVDCSLSIEAYLGLIDLGCTYDLIKKFIISGLTIEKDTKGVFLKTAVGKYYFKDLSFRNIVGGNFVSEFNTDRRAWAQKYLTDYNMNQEQLDRVLGIGL